MEDNNFTIGFFVGVAVSALLVGTLIIPEMMNYYRERAVDGKIARYEVIKQNGKTKFIWNDEENRP